MSHTGAYSAQAVAFKRYAPIDPSTGKPRSQLDEERLRQEAVSKQNEPSPPRPKRAKPKLASSQAKPAAYGPNTPHPLRQSSSASSTLRQSKKVVRNSDEEEEEESELMRALKQPVDMPTIDASAVDFLEQLQRMKEAHARKLEMIEKAYFQKRNIGPPQDYTMNFSVDLDIPIGRSDFRSSSGSQSARSQRSSRYHADEEEDLAYDHEEYDLRVQPSDPEEAMHSARSSGSQHRPAPKKNAWQSEDEDDDDDDDLFAVQNKAGVKSAPPRPQQQQSTRPPSSPSYSQLGPSLSARSRTSNMNENNDFSAAEFADRRPPSRSGSVTSSKSRITIPEPFAFDSREKNRKKTIAQIRFEQELEEKKAKEEAELQKRFKANVIPATTIMPLFKQMQLADEARRQEVKRTSMEMTKSREKPFSFFERDKKAIEEREERARKIQEDEERRIEESKIKANPLPEHILMPVLGSLEEVEADRKARVKARAEELLAKSSLPPRMQLYAVSEEQENEDNNNNQAAASEAGAGKRSTYKDPNCTFKPHVNTTIPDFNALNAKFQEQLAKKKSGYKKTEPQPFAAALRVSKTTPEELAERAKQDELDLERRRWPHRRSSSSSGAKKPISSSTSPTPSSRRQAAKKSFESASEDEDDMFKVQNVVTVKAAPPGARARARPASAAAPAAPAAAKEEAVVVEPVKTKVTKTVELRQEQLKKMKEEEEKKKRALELEEIKRKETMKEAAKRIAPLLKTDNKEREERSSKTREAFVQGFKESSKAYKDRIKEMMERVASKPFLFQSQVAEARNRAEGRVAQLLKDTGNMDLLEEMMGRDKAERLTRGGGMSDSGASSSMSRPSNSGKNSSRNSVQYEEEERNEEEQEDRSDPEGDVEVVDEDGEEQQQHSNGNDEDF